MLEPQPSTVRRSSLAFAATYLVAIGSLGTLLGSTADSTSAFVDHYARTSGLVVDVVGGLALLAAGMTLVWVVVAVRRDLTDVGHGDAHRLVSAFASVGCALMAGAAGLILTVPLTSLLGRLTGDPGIAPDVQAGLAQAGAVVLFVSMIVVATVVLLLVSIASRGQQLSRSTRVAGRVTAVLAGVLGPSVGLLLPLGLWFVAFGLSWHARRALAP